MKKIYILLSAVLLGTSAMAQVEIREMQGSTVVGNDISGTVFEKTVSSNGLVAMPFSVLNVSGGDLTLKVTRLRLQDEAAWADNLCWGAEGDPDGLCYTAAQMSTNPWTSLTVTIADQTRATLMVDTDVEGGGAELYRYYIVQGQSNIIDSIDVHVSSTVGIQEQEEPLGMSVYPNPANNYLTISTTGTDGSCNVQITDVLGKVVYSDEIGVTKKLDVSDFKNGVYLVSVTEKGQLVQTRRIVVKH